MKLLRDNRDSSILFVAIISYSLHVSYVLMCTASRSVSAAVNSSFEFNCTTECTSDISWSYMSSPAFSAPQPKIFSSLTPACRQDERCHVNSTEMGRSLLRIDRVQFIDAGTYLCWTESNHSSYCEMSFNLTGNFLQCAYYNTSLLYADLHGHEC